RSRPCYLGTSPSVSCKRADSLALTVHLLVKVPPKVSISKLLGVVKGKTALRIFTKFPYLRNKPYWGNHFWAKGYCVDTVGVDAEMIRKYVKYQEK
uniref:IS200/IS605 family transposase n=1 Tax=Thiolapillus sp. TaxID=2017437 RepID=UPI003AF611E3